MKRSFKVGNAFKYYRGRCNDIWEIAETSVYTYSVATPGNYLLMPGVIVRGLNC